MCDTPTEEWIHKPKAIKPFNFFDVAGINSVLIFNTCMEYLPMDHSIFFVVNLDKLSKPTGVVIVDCFSITKSLQETKQYNYDMNKNNIQPKKCTMSCPEHRASDIFQVWWAEVTHGAKHGGSFLKLWAQAYQTYSWHLGSTCILYYTCMHLCIDCWLYSKTCLKCPLKKEDQLSLNSGQKYCRMHQGEHSAILSTFIKLPFVIKVFVLSFFEWLLKTWQPTCTFCFVEIIDEYLY